jgi:hypothetical protein
VLDNALTGQRVTAQARWINIVAEKLGCGCEPIGKTGDVDRDVEI